MLEKAIIRLNNALFLRTLWYPSADIEGGEPVEIDGNPEGWAIDSIKTWHSYVDITIKRIQAGEVKHDGQT